MAELWTLVLLSVLVTQLSLIKSDDEVVELLLRQAIAQQNYMEETARMNGASGVRQIRISHRGGTKSYFYSTHVDDRMMAIHNHANLINTMGMGELDVVLNGVQFRTRHNDYKLRMPHRTSSGYKDSEDIPFPEVPPEVTQYIAVEDQIKEMKEFYRAFKEQDTSIRDYKKYFKPVLCYLEGTWTTSTKDIDEPFDSDRHFIDAKDWLDLQEKVSFTSYSGSKSESENYAYLPTRITELINNGTLPLIAQWNYRIRCAPVELKRDQGLDLNRFRLVDDLTAQLKNDQTAAEIANTRAARFSLDYWPRFKKEGREWERSYANGILDELMYQIPGYDNYPANLPDNAFGSQALTFSGETLNSARYHRIYKQARTDAMGSAARRRGFADQNVFMAQNTRPNIPGAKYESCKKVNRKEVCTEFRQRWSFAIPLEIIYLTPLLTWNPYKLHYHERADKQKVTMGGRNGGLTTDKAYNGSTYNYFFRTPKEFFDDENSSDAADTSGSVVGVLGPDGIVHEVKSSGTRILLHIQGLGQVRTRYPVAPIYNDGNQIYKELEALKDIVLRMQQYSDILKEPVYSGGNEGTDGNDGNSGNGIPGPQTFAMGKTLKNPPGEHTHLISLASDDIMTLNRTNGRVTVETSQGAGHTHSVKLGIVDNRLKILRCDGNFRCFDEHPKFVSSANDFIADLRADNLQS